MGWGTLCPYPLWIPSLCDDVLRAQLHCIATSDPDSMKEWFRSVAGAEGVISREEFRVALVSAVDGMTSKQVGACCSGSGVAAPPRGFPSTHHRL